MPKLGESSRRDQTLRAFCLVLIVVQNSSLILVTSYSRTLRPAYLPTVAVFYAECLKFAAAVLLLAAEESSLRRAVSLVAALPFEHGSTTLLFAVPALCYTLQNNLWYYALSHLDPVTAAVTSQMKVITTAVATVLMLDRRLNLPQWGALLVLTLGLVVMQLQDKTGGNGSQDRNSLSGAGAMLLATMLSAYSGVFLEKLFKSLPLTLWLQSIQLSLFALPTAWVSLPLEVPLKRTRVPAFQPVLSAVGMERTCTCVLLPSAACRCTHCVSLPRATSALPPSRPSRPRLGPSSGTGHHGCV